jgi:hypothetical protein
LRDAACGDLLSGISLHKLKTEFQNFKEKADKVGFKFKVIIDGPELNQDKAEFTNQSNLLKHFYHNLWKLEVIEKLYRKKKDSKEWKQIAKSIDEVKALIYESKFHEWILQKELAEILCETALELNIDFMIAPGRANNQIVWLYSYDYCDAILGDLSLLPFCDTVPSLIIDLDFVSQQFTFVKMKEFGDSLGLSKGKEKRISELLSFLVPSEAVTHTDISILNTLSSPIASAMEANKKSLQERQKKLKDVIDLIEAVMSRMDCNNTNNEKIFKEHFEEATAHKFPSREANIFKADQGQIMNSQCELAIYPATKSYTITDSDKQKYRVTIHWDLSANKKFPVYLCLDLMNKFFLQLSAKATKNHAYFAPPVADSKEYREVMESYVIPGLELSYAYFISNLGKVFVINDYSVETYYSKEPKILDVKKHLSALENGEKSLMFFREAAFKKYEKDNSSKVSSHKLSLKYSLAMLFQAVKSAPESSDLSLSPVNLKKPTSGSSDPSMTQREILGLVMTNLLHELEYVKPGGQDAAAAWSGADAEGHRAAGGEARGDLRVHQARAAQRGVHEPARDLAVQAPEAQPGPLPAGLSPEELRGHPRGRQAGRRAPGR